MQDNSSRILNFSSGPGVLPQPVLLRARDEMLSIEGSGMSVMEISHRSELFEGILSKAESGIRDLLDLPYNYKVLFLQGGATFQFSMVPLNFLRGSADYVVTGTWGEKAVKEAQRCGDVNVIYDGKASGYGSIPHKGDMRYSDGASYVHYTSNETIDGVEFDYDLNTGSLPVICDASSNILSKPIDTGRYSMIYAGAQKNLGPSGVTIVIINDELLERVPDGQHSLLDYRNIAANNSMANTPNTWGIYLISLVCDWLKGQGGVEAIAGVNEQKAKVLYAAIDNSDGFYRGKADPSARSRMNVTFRLPAAMLDEKFCSEAEQNGMNGLRGHRTVGGVRASIYNAFPAEGVNTLTEFMSDFAARHR
ncbi:MAG: 3-phosphoserine/phosphohydroxythreonine transaminase [Acidobacteria bacterium]|nr:MAG: 3-phosphoserine/phosphohydroxythreonine transaminase [Acidobacteriota bacterium]